jgi:hypothetical protein
MNVTVDTAKVLDLTPEDRDSIYVVSSISNVATAPRAGEKEASLTGAECPEIYLFIFNITVVVLRRID